MERQGSTQRADALKLAEVLKSALRQVQVGIDGHVIEHKCLQCFFPSRLGVRPLCFL